MHLIDRFRGCLLGLAVGDALGTSLEFQPRDTFPPLTDMIGGGPFDLQPGEWTDDTSMALCLAASLVEANGFDARDQMERYLRWRDHGYLSSNGRCFDIGNTVNQALRRYARTGDPFSGSTDLHTAGNGSLMRLAPVVLFYYPDHQQACDRAEESSRTTHAARQCLDACRYFAELLCRALDGWEKPELLGTPFLEGIATAAVREIAHGEYIYKSREDIHGTGYVVNSLEAALWCFGQTDSFSAAVLLAANLGDDADTTAAICGQLAGAYYGEAGIPAEWLEKLAHRKMIARIAEHLHNTG
jgi:ADP-ribosyl-[dinitrogen reductase] hydrolase